ncbi:hypothetical protein, partial [Bifidobacterium pseudocatenulatum]|uniref:hypothetical protein n=1 Tax=Bifidobacterium pseudocatenulatum TaxID=28026 RepID=UPI0022DEC8CE
AFCDGQVLYQPAIGQAPKLCSTRQVCLQNPSWTQFRGHNTEKISENRPFHLDRSDFALYAT